MDSFIGKRVWTPFPGDRRPHGKAPQYIFFIDKQQVPADRFRDVTYCKFVCSVCDQKKEANRTRAVLGSNLVHFPGDVGTPTADMMLFKILLNSVVSTPGAKFMTINISNFYLNTPITHYKYVKMRLTDIPDEVVQEYKLHKPAGRPRLTALSM